MAKNDKTLIDGIIDEKIELNIISTKKRDEVFEFFVYEQLLKDYDLSTEEIFSGSVDGRNDGGIDGFFIFVNGHLLLDINNFVWPKSNSELELWVITCKHHDTFKQAPLDNLVASISELFDFSKENDELQLEYSDLVLEQRNKFKYAYRKISPRLNDFKIKFCYGSRGNTDELGDAILQRAEQVKAISLDFFGKNCNSEFLFIGSAELVELNRKVPNFTLELQFSDELSNDETYVLLVKLKDYYSFITDSGKLRRYLFDSNVRDFMGLNQVNQDIKKTLLNNNSPDFWWLNNGITILATGASIIGKSIQIQDIQIVNGLQTSESIFRYFDEGGQDEKKRSVLVKVIVSNINESRDAIIRATNNQTFVELSALHATDKIQRDIEEILKTNEYYFERRTNFYKNQGFPSDKIVTPLYLASGFLSIILKAPEQGTILRSKFMRNKTQYETIFSESNNLEIWPKIAYILKETDKFLETKRPNATSLSEHFLKYRRQYLSFFGVSLLLNKYNFTIDDLVKIDIKNLTKDIFENAWEILHGHFQTYNKKKLKRMTFIEICKEIELKYGVTGIDFLGYNFGINKANMSVAKKIELTSEFIDLINKQLPDQPWKKSVAYELSIVNDCSPASVREAINYLIAKGLRYRQVNGELFDSVWNKINLK